MSGYFGDLSPAQQDALDELKTATSQDYPTNEATLLRFLRARSFNVEAAEKQYIHQCHWRKENDADNILNHPPPLNKEIMQIVSMGYHKYDKDGRPIYVELTGKIDANKLLKLPLKEVVRRHIWHNEKQFGRADELSKQLGKNIERTCQIHDMSGLSMSHRKCLSIFKHCSKIDQEVYPERMGRVIFVNVPWLFPLLWKIVSPFLDPETRRKFVVLGVADLHKLLDYVDPENLPEIFGGTCRCPDGCMHIVPGHLGGKIDDIQNLIQASIKAGNSFNEYMHCQGKGETIYWYYIAASTDLKFGVVWQPKESTESEVIVALQSVILHPTEGHYVAECPGTLTITFDNTSSTWLSKSVKYRISVNHVIEDFVEELNANDAGTKQEDTNTHDTET